MVSKVGSEYVCDGIVDDACSCVEYRMYDLYLGWIGIVLWIWVSVIWRDRALIMLNTVSWFMLTVAIMKEWAGV